MKEPCEQDTFGAAKTEEVPVATNPNYTPMVVTAETASKFSNDKQLERLYESMNADLYRKRAKTWKKVGLIGGGILVAGALALLPIDFDYGSLKYGLIGGLGGGGVLLFTTSYIKSHHYNKKAEKATMYTSSICGQDINFANGTSLNIGIDAIGTPNSFNMSLGVGVRYTF